MNQDNKVLKVRLFVGCQVTSEIRMHLNASALWKETLLFPSETHLVEMRYDDGYVIGRYVVEKKIILDELKEQKEEISAILQSYCPKLTLNHLTFLVYSQIFVY